MRDETLAAIARALDGYEEGTRKALILNAIAAFIAGDATAQRVLGNQVDLANARRNSSDFMRQYQSDLLERGGSQVSVMQEDGTYTTEFRPWLQDATDETRGEVLRIIKDGIDRGAPLGRKESATGTYPDGSIASDLQVYFDIRKSHASTVARTEAGRIATEGARRRYVDYGATTGRIVNGAEPCPICQERDGLIVDLTDPAVVIKPHPNCTCDVVPIIEGRE